MIAFAIFCRVGTCLSLAPGFSSTRVPARVRLFVALGLTVAMAPSIIDETSANSMRLTPVRILSLVMGECGIGATMGIMGRLLFASLETAFTAASMAIGLSSAFAPRIDESDSMPELAAFAVFAATATLFVADLHWEIVRAIHDSYAAFPLGAPLPPRFALDRIGETLSFGSSTAVRLASPFFLFGIVCNFMLAILNKITPQVAIYFVSTPAVMLGGLVLLPAIWPDIAAGFLAAFSEWLRGM